MGKDNQSTFKFQMNGLKELKRDLRKLKLTSELSPAHKVTSTIVAKAGQREAPRGPTGDLRRSVLPRPLKTAGRVKAGTKVRTSYAAPIHWGWKARNIKPNHFILRGFKKVEPLVHKVYRDEIHRISKRLGRKY